jgi:hypothetical protein
MHDDDYWDYANEAAEEAYREELYKELGPEWARDHAEELLQEHYDDAVSLFTSERLQSYYLKHPSLAIPAHEALLYARALTPAFHRAALIFGVTSMELTVKNVLLKPIIAGLVHNEDLASFIADLTTKQQGMDRFQSLLIGILSQFGGVELRTFKRPASTETLWQEMGEIQTARNDVIHRGETATVDIATLSILVAETLLNEIFPKILAKIGLHLHSPLTVCGDAHPKSK